MPLVTEIGADRVVRVDPADRCRVALDRGGVVGDAEHHRLHPLGTRHRDLVHVDHARRGLDQHRDPDPALEPRGGLDLVEQRGHKLDVARAPDLRDQDRVDVPAGLLHHVDDVAVAVVGVEPVDAYGHRAVGPGEVVESVHYVAARLLLVVGRDGILEVEHHDVRAETGRLLEHPGVAAGHGELAAVESCSFGHGSQ